MKTAPQKNVPNSGDLDLVTFSSCPVCGKNIRCFGTLDHRRFSQCLACRHIFSAVYSPRCLNELYSQNYYSSDNDPRIGEWVNKHTAIWNGLCHSLEQHAENTAKLLDVGAGTGGFLKTFKQRHPTAKLSAVEPSANARGALVHTFGENLELYSDISQVRKPVEGFNAITLFQTLEHVGEVLPFSIAIAELLASDGTLLVTVPNRLSYHVFLHGYKKDTLGFGNGTHLQFFSWSSLRLLLEKAGFTHVKRLVGFGGSNVNSFPGKLLQYLLRAGNISSEIRVIAKKKGNKLPAP